ncbi:hypothetical protein [Nitrincola sp.]|uniref:hypothetical protein n=1 Tax=Nitrincola sp. TaxID=1926584 RepID=UPI003A8E72F9
MQLRKYSIFLLLVIWCSSLLADEATVTLVTPSGELQISANELRAMAGNELEIYDPFQRVSIPVRGVDLIDFIEHFATDHSQASRLKFIASDDYETHISQWNSGNWLLVTHENGHELRLRDHGPIKLVEKSLGNRNPENLRNFNDWVWMITTIEVLE